MRAGDHTEIVDGQPRVDAAEDLRHARMHGCDLRIVGHDGVVVDDQIDVQIALGLPLDLVEDLMRDERVDAVVKLRVDAGKSGGRGRSRAPSDRGCRECWGARS